MLRKPVYFPEALEEFDQAIAFGLSEWGRELVEELVAEFEAKVSYICADWVQRRPDGYGVFRINLAKFPYHLIYRLKEDQVEIIAFSHHGKRDQYWRERL